MLLGIMAVSSAALVYLLILGTSDPVQRRLDDEEQMEYLRNLRKGENKYT